MENEKRVEKTGRFNKRIIVVILFLIITAVASFIALRGSYLEKMEIGQNFISVYWTNLKYKSISILATFTILFFSMFATNKRIAKGLKDFFDDEKKKMPKLPNKSISLIVSVLVSFCTANVTTNKLLLFVNSASFQMQDKVFGNDLSYYLFQKPFIEYLLWFGIITLVTLTIYMGVYYIVALNTQFDGVRSETLKSSKIVNQILGNAKLLSILIAILTFFKTQDLSSNKFLIIGDKSTYSLYGAGVTDLNIKLWGYRLLSVLIVFSVFMAVSFYKKGKTKKVIGSLLTVPAYLCLMVITLFGYDSLFIKSNELDKQKSYINYNIESTRKAYNIEIDEISVNNAGALSNDDIELNAVLLNKVSIVNKDLVLQDLNGTLTNKGFYAYNSSQIGEYLIDGKSSVVYISPREIVSQRDSYVNSTYEYTHGYGVIATSASSTNQIGNLENYLKEFNDTDIKINEPRIYFGLQTNEIIVTNSTTKKEFDYPISEVDNQTNEYNGAAGLKLKFLDRLILAVSNGNAKLAFSSDVNSDSKILTNRNILKRAKEIMPYLVYDDNPYLVITDTGDLVWVIDAYTTSNYYPYSQKSDFKGESINYIRNSVKVIVDAYDGTTKFYITDRTDPIVMTYRKAYSDLFEDLDEKIPAEISNHFVYPETLYNVQAEILRRYHNVHADVLYRTDDVWDIATYSTGNASSNSIVPMQPYYTMMKNINNTSNTLGLVLPYTVSGKQNLTSYLAGTYENGTPKLQLYVFPEDSNVVGLLQLDTQIEQNEEIYKQIEKLNVTGTKLTKQMLAIPINDKLLYIEAIYQQYINEENSLPTLKKIVVASGSKVAIGDNLRTALLNLVSQNAVNIEIQDTNDIQGLIELIIKANENLEKSTANGDWEQVGKDMEKLQGLIDKLDKVYQQEKEKDNKQDNNKTNVNQKENEIKERL